MLTPEDRFLAENYSLRYVSSGRDLLATSKSSTNLDLVLFSGPQFSANAPAAFGATNTELIPLTNAPEIAAKLETQAAQANWSVKKFLGTSATEGQLRSLHSPGILHFITRGLLLPETFAGTNSHTYNSLISTPEASEPEVSLRNPLMRSGIALTGAQDTLTGWKHGEGRPDYNDGIVTAEDAGVLDLANTWLVALPACDTSIELVNGGDGLLGLRRGFIQAGAENLLISVWPATDESSTRLMLTITYLPRARKTGNAPEALATVQRDWLAATRKSRGLLAAVSVAGPFILNTQGQRSLQGPTPESPDEKYSSTPP